MFYIPWNKRCDESMSVLTESEFGNYDIKLFYVRYLLIIYSQSV